MPILKGSNERPKKEFPKGTRIWESNRKDCDTLLARKKKKEANKVITILFHLLPLVPRLLDRYTSTKIPKWK